MNARGSRESEREPEEDTVRAAVGGGGKQPVSRWKEARGPRSAGKLREVSETLVMPASARERE